MSNNNIEEAKERLNKCETIEILYGNTFAMNLQQLSQLQEDIGTVLKELKNKENIIEEVKQIRDKMEVEDYYTLKNAIDDLNKLLGEIDMELKKAKRIISKKTETLQKELDIEIEDKSDEPRILYLIQEIEANKTVLQELEKLQQKEKSRIIGNINEVKIEDLEPVLKPYYIPKKKIEERIEEYKKISDEFYVKFLKSNKLDMEIHDAGISCDAKVQILKELLEEKE